jgi:hypothetical protein
VLLTNGSNYRKWARRLRELASQFIYDPDLFTKPTSNIHNEKIDQAIILHSVDASLEDELSNFPTCYKAVKNLRTRFCSVCRSAQISTFLHLLCVEPDMFETTAVYSVEMRNVLSNLKASDIHMTEDQLLGSLLQINLKDGPFKKALTDRVESVMYDDPLHKTKGAAQTHAPNACPKAATPGFRVQGGTFACPEPRGMTGFHQEGSGEPGTCIFYFNQSFFLWFL